METTISIPYLGVAKTSQKIVPGSTATGISPNVLGYTRFTVAYTSGGSTEIKAGMTIVGATSGTTGRVVSITLTSGTWAGGDAAGVITMDSVSGAWTNNEKLKVGAGTDDATMTGTPAYDNSAYEHKNSAAKAVIVQAKAQSALITLDGSTPDQTLKKGITLTAGSSMTIVGPENIRNLLVMDETNNSATTVNVTCFFHGPWGVAA